MEEADHYGEHSDSVDDRLLQSLDHGHWVHDIVVATTMMQMTMASNPKWRTVGTLSLEFMERNDKLENIGS